MHNQGPRHLLGVTEQRAAWQWFHHHHTPAPRRPPRPRAPLPTPTPSTCTPAPRRRPPSIKPTRLGGTHCPWQPRGTQAEELRREKTMATPTASSKRRRSEEDQRGVVGEERQWWWRQCWPHTSVDPVAASIHRRISHPLCPMLIAPHGRTPVPQPRRSPGAERTGVDGGAKRMGSSGGSRCGRREGAVAAADGGAWGGRGGEERERVQPWGGVGPVRRRR
jgi:hypothetical protein